MFQDKKLFFSSATEEEVRGTGAEPVKKFGHFTVDIFLESCLKKKRERENLLQAQMALAPEPF